MVHLPDLILRGRPLPNHRCYLAATSVLKQTLQICNTSSTLLSAMKKAQAVQDALTNPVICRATLNPKNTCYAKGREVLGHKVNFFPTIVEGSLSSSTRNLNFSYRNCSTLSKLVILGRWKEDLNLPACLFHLHGWAASADCIRTSTVEPHCCRSCTCCLASVVRCSLV